jgi:hypothetical protein
MGKILVDLLSDKSGFFGVTEGGDKVRLTVNRDFPLTTGNIVYATEENLQRQIKTFCVMNRGYLYIDRDKAVKSSDRIWIQPYVYIPSNS